MNAFGVSMMTRPLFYVLDGTTPVPEDDQSWGEAFREMDRTVDRTDVGEMVVSTVFLGIDHCSDSGPPQLFETMVFDPWGGSQLHERYATWDEAAAGHQRCCDKLQRQ